MNSPNTPRHAAETFGPCSCNDSGKCKYIDGSPACMQEDECDHEWRFVGHSYEGDPSVPHGTRDFRVFQCEKCGEEENRQ